MVLNLVQHTLQHKKIRWWNTIKFLFSVQNCEDGNSSFSCGQSSGADDSYNLHIKIKDAQGNTLSTDDNYKT